MSTKAIGKQTGENNGVEFIPLLNWHGIPEAIAGKTEAGKISNDMRSILQ